MSGEETELSVRLPPDLSDWVAELAGESDDREAVVRDLLAAYRSVKADRGDRVTPAELAGRLDEQREEYRDLVEDVRERVIQVKHETDAKAPEDHGHPELVETVAETERQLSALESEIADLQAELERVESDLQSGFENYEDVLEYLTDTTDDLSDDLDTLAGAVVSLRERTAELTAAAEARAETDRLKLAANQLGIRTADCDECDTTVDVALLTDPECPHCRSRFEDVEEGNGFFSSNVLVTGDAPAIEGSVGVDTDELEAIAAVGNETPPPDRSDDGGDPA